MDPLAFVPACNASLTGGMGGSASFSAAWSGFVSFFLAYFIMWGFWSLEKLNEALAKIKITVE